MLTTLGLIVAVACLTAVATVFAVDFFNDRSAERWARKHGWCPQCGRDLPPGATQDGKP